MNIDDLTMKQLREIASMFSVPSVQSPQHHAWKVGKPYLIRTVTMINTGILIGVLPQELVLKDAAWIADTGRFSDALRTGNFDEVEPFPDGEVIIGRAAIIDAVVIPEVPRSQK